MKSRIIEHDFDLADKITKLAILEYAVCSDIECIKSLCDELVILTKLNYDCEPTIKARLLGRGFK